jgi:hypothetical protein
LLAFNFGDASPSRQTPWFIELDGGHTSPNALGVARRTSIEIALSAERLVDPSRSMVVRAVISQML